MYYDFFSLFSGMFQVSPAGNLRFSEINAKPGAKRTPIPVKTKAFGAPIAILSTALALTAFHAAVHGTGTFAEQPTGTLSS